MPIDVRVDVGPRRPVGVRDRDQRGQVVDDPRAAHQVVRRRRVAHVAGQHLDLGEHVRRQRVQPAPGVEGVVEHHGAHPLPVAHQPFHEVRADEALRTRHRDDLGHCSSPFRCVTRLGSRTVPATSTNPVNSRALASSWADITSTVPAGSPSTRAASSASAARAGESGACTDAQRLQQQRDEQRGSERQVRRAEHGGVRGDRPGQHRHRRRDQHRGDREVAQHRRQQDPPRTGAELRHGAAAVQERLDVAAVAVQAPLRGAHAQRQRERQYGGRRDDRSRAEPDHRDREGEQPRGGEPELRLRAARRAARHGSG